MNPMDEITLTGLRANAFHGVFDHEREEGQVFIVDATAYLDLSGAGTQDDLEQTVHYGILAEEIVAAVERDPVDLIETVAERIAQVILAHGAVKVTRVTVHKPSAPITVPFEDVSVTITRAKPVSSFQAGFGVNP